MLHCYTLEHSILRYVYVLQETYLIVQLVLAIKYRYSHCSFSEVYIRVQLVPVRSMRLGFPGAMFYHTIQHKVSRLSLVLGWSVVYSSLSLSNKFIIPPSKHFSKKFFQTVAISTFLKIKSHLIHYILCSFKLFIC